MEARDEKRLLKLQAQLAAVKLLIIDELGYVPLSQTGAELLFEIFSQRHERGSTIVTSNLPFEEWTSVFQSQRLTGAARSPHPPCPYSGAQRRELPAETRRGGAVKGDPPIPKPARPSAPPERRVRPGSETLAISAGPDAAHRALRSRQTGLILLRPRGLVLLRH